MASNSFRVVGKNDARYWRAKIFKLTDPRGGELAHWATRTQWRGKRHRFALGTANKEAAAAKAAEIWRDLVAHGLEVTLAKHRSAAKDTQASIAATTIGEWIAAAGKVWDGKPATYGGYARAVRFIASEILALSKSSKRFGRTQARTYRNEVDGVPLAMLSPQAIQAWRIQYLSRAGDNPARQRAARISCLPRAAMRELNPDVLNALLLALCAGLRGPCRTGGRYSPDCSPGSGCRFP